MNRQVSTTAEIEAEPTAAVDAPSRTAAIELIGVAKRFHSRRGSVAAVEHLDLAIAEGEFFSLLGPSGCGKTTTLRMIGGFEEPSRGRILLHGTDVVGVPPNRRDVNMVFQSYALFPNMSVAENIGYGLKIRGLNGAERSTRVAELVALTGIEGLEHRRIDQLSGGQRQRVALARAVAVRPSVLLLDEPLTALDAALRERLRGELNRLLRTLGITTVYVTHDQSEAMVLGDRIVVMRKGAVAQVGTPRDIYFAPASRFVAEFIGAANIVEAAYSGGSLVSWRQTCRELGQCTNERLGRGDDPAGIDQDCRCRGRGALRAS